MAKINPKAPFNGQPGAMPNRAYIATHLAEGAIVHVADTHASLIHWETFAATCVKAADFLIAELNKEPEQPKEKKDA